jgi:hypothetical protein
MGKLEINITPAAISALANNDIENFMAAITPGGIEAQEARGQTKLVESLRMPKKLNSYEPEFKGKTAAYLYEKWGCTIGKSIDDLFIEVKLPEGWKKVSTDHAMWSKLLDNNGKIRATIFYKAAFYDMDAFLSPSTRFHVTYEMVNWREEGRDTYERFMKEQRYGVIKDGDDIIYKTEPESFTVPYPVPTYEERVRIPRGESPEGHREWWHQHDQWEKSIHQKAEAILVAQFPDYEDHFKYWEILNVQF